MDFQTEESGKKGFNLKKLLPIVAVLVVLIIIIIIISSISKSKNNKKTTPKKTEETVVLNSELEGTYAIAREDNHIVALKKDGNAKKIYNITQGTGNLGEFRDYTYYDSKIYMLFGDTNIYSISLTAGNGIYELQKEFVYEPMKCKNGKQGKTNTIIVTDDIIYFNNSSCGVSGFNYSEEGYDKQINIHQFNDLTSSSMAYEDGLLFFQGDNSIYALDESTADITEVVKQKATGDVSITINEGVLLYTSKTDNNYEYFGYNISANQSAAIVKNAKKLYIYDNQYLYYDNNGVYLYDGENVEKIYSLRYNQLKDMELLDDSTLQIVDKSTNGDNKIRVINIDLENNNKTKNVTHTYTSIRKVQ